MLPQRIRLQDPRSIHEGARQMARDICAAEEGRTSLRERKKVEMLFAHLRRILKLDRLRLRGQNGARDEFHLAAGAQNPREARQAVPAGASEPGLTGRDRLHAGSIPCPNRCSIQIRHACFDESRPYRPLGWFWRLL